MSGYNPALTSVIFDGSTSGTVSLEAPAVAGAVTVTLPAASGTMALVLTGTTGSIGGAAISAGQSTSGTAAITGATTSMAVIVSPSANPQVDANHALTIWGYVSSAGVVTVVVGAIVGTTPVATTYNVRVIQ
jgi:hypothetical protein